MDISLIHAGLAAGAALAALPVILHLFMRQTPKHVIFPALRLIRERQKRSQKKLKVKNWLLLLARMALVALMALALARPRLFSQTSLGDQEVPTAIGPGLRHQPVDGLQGEATRRGSTRPRSGRCEILKKTPDTSQVFVVDSAEPGRADRPGRRRPARKRIEGLALHAANRPLNAAMGQAYAAVVECDRARHEVYVLTDLARSAWNPAATVEGLDQLPKVKSGVATFVLRLTPQEVHDVAVVEAKPSASVATQGETGRDPRQAPVAGAGVEAGRRALPRRRPEGREAGRAARQRRGRGQVHDPQARPGGRASPGLLRLSGAPDPLEFDDKRYFTFKVQPALKVVHRLRPARSTPSSSAMRSTPTRRLSPGTPRPFQVESVRDAGLRRTRSGAAQGLRRRLPAQCPGARCRRLGPAQRLRPRGGRPRRRPGRSMSPRRTTPARPSRSSCRRRSARSQPRRRTSASAGSTTPPTRSSAAIPRSSTRAGAGAGLSLLGGHTRIEGARTLLTFADNAPALLERTIHGPQDRPRPALDHPPGAPDRSRSRPRPGTSFRAGSSAGRSTT